MFYAKKNSQDVFASMLLGDEYTCFHHAHLTGRAPFFLVEVPCEINEDGEHFTMSKPMLISGLNELKILCLQQGKTLDELKVSMVFHGFMTNEPDWQCQRVSDINYGEWTQKKQKLDTVRIVLSNGKTVYFNGMEPSKSANVTWEKLL